MVLSTILDDGRKQLRSVPHGLPFAVSSYEISALYCSLYWFFAILFLLSTCRRLLLLVF